MKPSTFAALFAGVSLALAAPVQAHKLVEAGKTVTVAQSGLSVSPAIDWNRLNLRPGKNSERWTLDGELLNDVVFFAAIESEQPLVREVNRKEQPLPKFRSDMLPIDIPALVESTHRIANGAAVFEVLSSEPTELGGFPGIRFTYEFVGADDLRRRGLASASIVEGKLYMVSFEAPAIHYFERDIANFEQLLASVRISPE